MPVNVFAAQSVDALAIPELQGTEVCKSPTKRQNLKNQKKKRRINQMRKTKKPAKLTLAEKSQAFLNRHPELATFSPSLEVFMRCSACGLFFDASEGFGFYCSPSCETRATSSRHVSNQIGWEGNYGV
jgi:hypothetical protein